jgi:hypothetical protein
MMFQVTRKSNKKSLISIGGTNMFVIPAVCVGAMIFLFGHLHGYEKCDRDRGKDIEFWKEVEKHGL